MVFVNLLNVKISSKKNLLSLILASMNAQFNFDKPIRDAKEIQIQLIFNLFHIFMLEVETCIICVKE